MNSFPRLLLAAICSLVALSSCGQQQPHEKPTLPHENWMPLIGRYASESDTVLVFEKDGLLHLLDKRMDGIVLKETESGRDAFVSDDGSEVTFHSNGEIRFEWKNSTFRRLEEGGATFRIFPLRPIPELRATALTTQPPTEHGTFHDADLVEIIALDSTIKLDIRYATTNNFMDARVYSEARAFLQRPAAEAVVKGHWILRRFGYGILIHDAYRPWYVTKIFWDATPEHLHDFVADPSKGSRHNRGCAVDLTLYELATGNVVEMPSGYDEFSERAFPDYKGGTSLQRWHRDLLRRTMEQVGFDVYEYEWWHFDFRGWERFPIMNMTFENISE